jgi:hypothetical protein
VEQALYLLWKQGVSVITWYLIRDQPPSPTYFTSSESGMYYFNGRAKPAATAFRFPVVADRSGGRTFVWLRAPAAGLISFAARIGRWWRVVARRQVTAFEVLKVGVPNGDRSFRATLGHFTSLTRPEMTGVIADRASAPTSFAAAPRSA